MTHYGYLRTLLNVNAMPTNKEIILALDEQEARIAELEGEVKMWITEALRWEKRARELMPLEERLASISKSINSWVTARIIELERSKENEK